MRRDNARLARTTLLNIFIYYLSTRFSKSNHPTNHPINTTNQPPNQHNHPINTTNQHNQSTQPSNQHQPTKLKSNHLITKSNKQEEMGAGRSCHNFSVYQDPNLLGLFFFLIDFFLPHFYFFLFYLFPLFSIFFLLSP